MLADWLSPDDHHALLSARRMRHAFANAGAAREHAPLFGWQLFDRVLQARPLTDTLVVHKNELLDQPPPASAADLRALFATGAGVVIRRAERHDPALAKLACGYERELGGTAHVQLFATAGRTHGFGWHYDAEDVFIMQTEGVKTYYFRDNTQEPDFTNRQPDFTKVLRETSRTQTCTLRPGDSLYLPRGMWHVARAEHDSLSLSLGLAPAASPR